MVSHMNVNRTGDLLGMDLVKASVERDAMQLELLLSLVGLNAPEADPEVLGVVRSLTNALATTLETNLGHEGALHQLKLWRDAMRAQSLRERA